MLYGPAGRSRQEVMQDHRQGHRRRNSLDDSLKLYGESK
jgi:hypothetical protein